MLELLEFRSLNLPSHCWSIWLHIIIIPVTQNLERLLHKVVPGIQVREAAKAASHTLRIVLRQHRGTDVITLLTATCLRQIDTRIMRN